MKQRFITKEGNEKLILFFAGWGMDHHLLAHCHVPDCDVAICYDYTDMRFDYSLYQYYTSIVLVAWSMGVWGAAVALKDTPLSFVKKIAVNGTLSPIDEQYGIAPDLFNGTLAGLTEHSLSKFYRRMCLSTSDYDCFKQKKPKRSIEDIKTELATIKQLVENSETAMTFRYDRAYIGDNDRIFRPSAQQSAWDRAHVPSVHIPQAHYIDFNLLFENV